MPAAIDPAQTSAVGEGEGHLDQDVGQARFWLAYHLAQPDG